MEYIFNKSIYAYFFKASGAEKWLDNIICKLTSKNCVGSQVRSRNNLISRFAIALIFSVDGVCSSSFFNSEACKSVLLDSYKGGPRIFQWTHSRENFVLPLTFENSRELLQKSGVRKEDRGKLYTSFQLCCNIWRKRLLAIPRPRSRPLPRVLVEMNKNSLFKLKNWQKEFSIP